jgi:hypothetical protein
MPMRSRMWYSITSAMKPIQRAMAGGRLLQHGGAARLALEGVPHRLHMTTNAVELLQQLGRFLTP